MWASLDPERVHQSEHDLSEPAGVVRAQRRLARGPEARKIRGVDAVPAAQGSRGLEERRPGAPQPVNQQDVWAGAHGQGGDPVPAHRDVVDLKQRWPSAWEPEEPLEGDRVIQVPAHSEQPTLEGLDAGELALPQAHPGIRVGGDRDVGAHPRGPGPHPGGVRGAPDLPGPSQVTELDVVGRVEPRIGSQIALGQRAKRLLHRRQSLVLGGRGGHARAAYRRVRAAGPAVARVGAPWGVFRPATAGPRVVSLHDTRIRRGPTDRAPRAGTDRHVRLRSHGVRPDSCGQRPALRRLLAAQAVPRP